MTAKTLYDRLMKVFGNAYGVCGLMGNLFAESGLKSNNLQNTYQTKLGYTDESYTKAVDDGSYTNFVHDKAGYGLAQWTFYTRKEALLAYAKKVKTSIGDEDMQFDFLVNELKTSYKGVYTALKTATSVRQASDIVLTKFESPADQSNKVKLKRAEYGQEYFDKFAQKEKEETTMGNSSLVNCTVKSPNHSGKRTHAIDRISPHCVVGQLKAKNIGYCFDDSSRQASCNYGIGTEGDVCLIVDECNRSWCTSSNANDQRAVTIECASDSNAPYAMNSKVYNKLVDLCVDICKRNGKTKLLWFADKNKSLNYSPKSNEMVLTVHRWFANKSCPGDWLYSRLGELANTVTARLGGSSNNTPTTPQKPASTDTLYRVQTGAFSQKSNADNLVKKLKAKGYDTLLVKAGNLYKVQVGAYSKKSNAENMMKKLKADGFDAFITTSSGSAVGSSTPAKKSNAEIAKEIFKGTCSDPRWSSWGTGNTRKSRLKQAGYDPVAVQNEVNKLF